MKIPTSMSGSIENCSLEPPYMMNLTRASKTRPEWDCKSRFPRSSGAEREATARRSSKPVYGQSIDVSVVLHAHGTVGEVQATVGGVDHFLLTHPSLLEELKQQALFLVARGEELVEHLLRVNLWLFLDKLRPIVRLDLQALACDVMVLEER